MDPAARDQESPQDARGIERDRQVSSPIEARHFSPDPYRMTDRYRLVTPYRLPEHD
jgi:hypothetical protein